VELAQQAGRLTGGQNPSVLGTLAAAYAEAGRFPEAVAAAQRALELATARAAAVQVESLRARLGLYQAGSPYRDPGLAPRAEQPP
jgi:cytochrome c-type biogenesis protein CcmH/NrfG